MLVHDGRALPNNSLISLESLERAPLLCVTTDPFCCETNRSGNWFHPQEGAPLTDSPSAMDLYQSWGDDQSIQLNKPSNASILPMNEGLYRCEVPDRDGVTQVVYAGLYSETGGSK